MISTSVYRKATYTNQYLSFRSHHPMVHKVAVVRTLMIRADYLSSTSVEQTEEEKRVTGALRGNGYFIRKHTIPRRRRERVENKRPKTTFTLPYISGLSETIRCILNPLEVKVVCYPLQTLCQMLVHPQDLVPVEESKGVVYSIPCQDCSNVYTQASALAGHVFTTGHAVDLSQSEVLDHHQHTITCCTLESWHIQQSRTVLTGSEESYWKFTQHSWTD